MKKPIVKCPKCGSTNTREWSVGSSISTDKYLAGLHLFSDDDYKVFKKEFGDKADTEDYYCAQNICDDCDYHFATKNVIDVKVTKTIVFGKRNIEKEKD